MKVLYPQLTAILWLRGPGCLGAQWVDVGMFLLYSVLVSLLEKQN